MLAKVIAMNKVLNELDYLWLKEIILYDVKSIVLTHMASNFGVRLNFIYYFT
jgi:hypothetical protein